MKWKHSIKLYGTQFRHSKTFEFLGFHAVYSIKDAKGFKDVNDIHSLTCQVRNPAKNEIREWFNTI